MASTKNKLAFLPMPAPSSYAAGPRVPSGFTTRSDVGSARGGPSAEVVRACANKRGKEIEVDPEQYKDPDNEVNLMWNKRRREEPRSWFPTACSWETEARLNTKTLWTRDSRK
ncbi:hypothetical protein FIBSPDRAFT_814393 [Athelia psychrophila]|uniref:Uncharacterized protein n=1 Tax=Athelia psychrophila TaxID=1759441 RepID=A0A166TU77_9AGAM|nr:hypothetical protein FIBSPDRAFT_814393 [Fibularhizoctonia sp. CBS 109695]